MAVVAMGGATNTRNWTCSALGLALDIVCSWPTLTPTSRAPRQANRCELPLEDRRLADVSCPLKQAFVQCGAAWLMLGQRASPPN